MQPTECDVLFFQGDELNEDKKIEDKRGMSDYNGEMRRGGRGGGYRMPASKDMGSVDMGSYGDKVRFFFFLMNKSC